MGKFNGNILVDLIFDFLVLIFERRLSMSWTEAIISMIIGAIIGAAITKFVLYLIGY